MYDLFFKNVDNFNALVLGHAYHLTPEELADNDEFTRWTQQIESLGIYWGGSMSQSYGRNYLMEIQQSYISLEDYSGEMITTSQPVPLDFNKAVNLKNNLRYNNGIISPLYAKCKEFGEEYALEVGDRSELESAVINLGSFDISTDKKRVLT